MCDLKGPSHVIVHHIFLQPITIFMRHESRSPKAISLSFMVGLTHSHSRPRSSTEK